MKKHYLLVILLVGALLIGSGLPVGAYTVLKGILQGRVTDADTGDGIAGATVSVGLDGVTWPVMMTTDAAGDYGKEGQQYPSYFVRAEADGYETAIESGVAIIANQTTTLNFALNALPGTIEGRVTDAYTGTGIEGVYIKAGETWETSTDNQGDYTLTNVNPGTYTVQATKEGYESGSQSGVAVASEQTTTQNLTLTPIPSLSILPDGVFPGRDIGVTGEKFTPSKLYNIVLKRRYLDQGVEVEESLVVAEKTTNVDGEFEVPVFEIPPYTLSGEHSIVAVDPDTEAEVVLDTITVKEDLIPPTITHTPVTEGEVNKKISIQATVSDNAKVLKATLYYRAPAEEYTSVSMTLVEGTYQADIPAAGVTYKGLEYYILAEDYSGNEKTISGQSVTIPGTGSLLKCTLENMSPVTSFTIGDGMYFKVEDTDENKDPEVKESVEVTVKSTLTGDQKTVTLTETGLDTGIFLNTESVSTLYKGRLSTGLEVDYNDTVTVEYVDANDPSDTSGATVSIEPTQMGVTISYVDAADSSLQIIRYSLAQEKEVTLMIFSMTGELVWKGVYPAGQVGGLAGENIVRWNKRDLYGRTPPTGVYLFRIVSEGKVIDRGKMFISY